MIITGTMSVVTKIIAESNDNYVFIYSAGELLYRLENEVFLSLKSAGRIIAEK